MRVKEKEKDLDWWGGLLIKGFSKKQVKPPLTTSL
jgi:hypothetical protein